jgi:hypothetical protein
MIKEKNRFTLELANIERQLAKAKKHYANNARCLKMEVLDGKDIDCIWLDYCLHDKQRVNKLEERLSKLQEQFYL